jgi:hypothetical protein
LEEGIIEDNLLEDFRSIFTTFKKDFLPVQLI